MALQTDSTLYRVAKDENGFALEVFRNENGDQIRVPIDAANTQYARFVNWACNQSSQVAETYGRLESNALYFVDEREIVEYCKRHRILLFTISDGGINHQLFGGIHESPVAYIPISLRHSPRATVDSAAAPPSDRILFYRLYKAIPATGARADATDGLNWGRLPIFVSHHLHSRMNELLKDPDSQVRRISDLPVEKTFVYFDVSAFSQHPVGHQVLILNAITGTINDDGLWTNPASHEARTDLEASLCIGDGYIFVFKEPQLAAFFAAYLALLVEQRIASKKLIEFHFRMSVHTGPVFRFWDQCGTEAAKWNYVGKGITDGQRVLSAIGSDKDDVVFLSADTRKQIMGARLPHDHIYEVSRWLQNRGRQKDKHGEFRRLYELDHVGWIGEACGRLDV